MTDKEKILAEIEKRYEYWKEKEHHSHSVESEIRMSECQHLLQLLNSLPEESVSPCEECAAISVDCKEKCLTYNKWARENNKEESIEWSEEDEELLKLTLSNLAELKDRYGEGYGKVGKCMNWLNSLQPQPIDVEAAIAYQDGYQKALVEFSQKQQVWTEEDIDMINWLIRCCEKEHEELCNDRYGHQDIVSDLKRDCRKKWDWLESLKNKLSKE